MEKLTKSEARKKFWANKTPEDRRNHAQMMANKRYEGMTLDEKRAIAERMVKARRELRTIAGAETIINNNEQQ